MSRPHNFLSYFSILNVAFSAFRFRSSIFCCGHSCTASFLCHFRLPPWANGITQDPVVVAFKGVSNNTTANPSIGSTAQTASNSPLTGFSIGANAPMLGLIVLVVLGALSFGHFYAKNVATRDKQSAANTKAKESERKNY